MDSQSNEGECSFPKHAEQCIEKSARASKGWRMNGWQRNETDLDGVSVWLKEFACGPSEWLVNFSQAPAVARARRELDY